MLETGETRERSYVYPSASGTLRIGLRSRAKYEVTGAAGGGGAAMGHSYGSRLAGGGPSLIRAAVEEVADGGGTGTAHRSSKYPPP